MQTRLEKQVSSVTENKTENKKLAYKKDLTGRTVEQQKAEAAHEQFQVESADHLEKKDKVILDKKRKGVYGTDDAPISIEKDQNGYIIKGKPDADTKRIFEALLKTPQGVETAIQYTKAMYEFRFRLVDVVYDSDGKTKVHGETYEASADNNRLSETNTEFDHFNVDISLATTSDTDRMKGWSDEMKLNVIASHEKGHVSGAGEMQDEDHKKGITFAREMESAFEYNILYQDNSLIGEPWLQNYNNNELIGYKMVNKAYKAAVEALLQEHKLTKKDGDKTVELTKTEADKMITDFTAANTPKKDK